MPSPAWRRSHRSRRSKPTLTIDGATHRLTAHQVVIANGRYHAGRPIAAHASADDRQLVVHVIATRRRWRLLRALLGYFAQRDDRLRDTVVATGSQVAIECRPPQQVEIDGELKTSTPVTASIAAEALNVVVPPWFDDR